MSYYGLSKTSSTGIEYDGPIKEMPLDGDDMALYVDGVLENAPSARLLILPNMGVTIAIKTDDDYLAIHFKSPMSKSAAADLFKTLILTGRQIKMVDEYGAIELL